MMHTIQPFHTTLTLPSVEASWQAMLDNPVSGAMVRACTHEERQQVREALVEGLAPHTTPDGAVLLRASCLLLTARRPIAAAHWTDGGGG